jgi:hypothetical protein
MDWTVDAELHFVEERTSEVRWKTDVTQRPPVLQQKWLVTRYASDWTPIYHKAEWRDVPSVYEP